MAPKFRDMLPELRRVCWCLTAVFFFSNVVSQELFAHIRPRVPMPAIGRVYKLQMHYTIVYLTFVEHLIAGWPTFVLAIVFGIPAAWLSYRETTNK